MTRLFPDPADHQKRLERHSRQSCARCGRAAPPGCTLPAHPRARDTTERRRGAGRACALVPGEPAAGAGCRAPSCALAAVCGTGTETVGKLEMLSASSAPGSNVWRSHPDSGTASRWQRVWNDSRGAGVHADTPHTSPSRTHAADSCTRTRTLPSHAEGSPCRHLDTGQVTPGLQGLPQGRAVPSAGSPGTGSAAQGHRGTTASGP